MMSLHLSILQHVNLLEHLLVRAPLQDINVPELSTGFYSLLGWVSLLRG